MKQPLFCWFGADRKQLMNQGTTTLSGNPGPPTFATFQKGEVIIPSVFASP